MEREDNFSFHTDSVRMLDLNDFKTRRGLWWQTSVAKGDFEAFRKKLVDEENDPAEQSDP